MKKCQNCNQTFDETKKFCNKCGKPLITIEEIVSLKAQRSSALKTQQPPRKSPKIKIGIAISLIVILVAIILFLNFHSGTAKDVDGNIYHTVKIGKQTWTIENLRTTRFNDGIAIPLITNSAAWANSTSSGYCYYGNMTNADSINKFGALYNWYTIDTKKLAPKGWHVPTDAEWDTLQNYLIANGYNWDGTTTGNKIAKSLAAKSGWVTSTSVGAIGNDLSKNNKSGFSAFPSGCRLYNGGYIGDIGSNGYWWSIKTGIALNVGSRVLFYGSEYGIGQVDQLKNYGFSVRLLRD